MDSRGFDSAGRVFSNATEMWVEELGSTATATTSAAAEAEAAPTTAAAAGNGDAGEEASGDGKRKEWYSKAIAYWQVKHPTLPPPREALNPKPPIQVCAHRCKFSLEFYRNGS